MSKNIYYVVTKGFNTEMLKPEAQFVEDTILLIKSTWFKKSRGKGLYDYYEYSFYDSANNLIKDNNVFFDGFSCQFENCDVWRNIGGSTNSVTLKIIVTDKTGIALERIYDMYKNPEIKFLGILNYLKMIDLYGTHSAVKKISQLENALNKVNEKLK